MITANVECFQCCKCSVYAYIENNLPKLSKANIRYHILGGLPKLLGCQVFGIGLPLSPERLEAPCIPAQLCPLGAELHWLYLAGGPSPTQVTHSPSGYCGIKGAVNWQKWRGHFCFIQLILL